MPTKLPFEDRHPVAQALIMYRARNNLTQSALAEKTGLNQQTIGYLENKTSLANVGIHRAVLETFKNHCGLNFYDIVRVLDHVDKINRLGKPDGVDRIKIRKKRLNPIALAEKARELMEKALIELSKEKDELIKRISDIDAYKQRLEDAKDEFFKVLERY